MYEDCELRRGKLTLELQKLRERKEEDILKSSLTEITKKHMEQELKNLDANLEKNIEL